MLSFTGWGAALMAASEKLCDFQASAASTVCTRTPTRNWLNEAAGSYRCCLHGVELLNVTCGCLECVVQL